MHLLFHAAASNVVNFPARKEARIRPANFIKYSSARRVAELGHLRESRSDDFSYFPSHRLNFPLAFGSLMSLLETGKLSYFRRADSQRGLLPTRVVVRRN